MILSGFGCYFRTVDNINPELYLNNYIGMLMVFLDELAKHTETAYGVVALIFVLAITGTMKVKNKALKLKLFVGIVVIGIGAVLIINSSFRPPAQVFNQSNNGNGGTFNNNSGSGIQINNVNQK